MSRNIFQNATSLLRFLQWKRTQSLCTKMTTIDENKLPEELLKRKPSEPKPEDCCGDGCKVCVYDLYDQEMKIWKNECYVFLGYDVEKITTPTEINWMSPLCYTPCILKKIKYLTKNCNLYYFKLPENTALDVSPGQHLVMRGLVQDETITRQYTPVKSKSEAFNVLIKVYEDGLMSQFVSSWAEGCQVDWRGPSGTFTYKRNMHSKLVLLAAGTGIAPMIPIVQTILNEELDETRIKLCFCCKTYDDILMKDLLNEWKQFWNFQVTFYLSKEKDCSKVRYGDSVILGRLKISDVENEITNTAQTRVLICGTNDFSNEMKNHLGSLNFPEENVHVF